MKNFNYIEKPKLPQRLIDQVFLSLDNPNIFKFQKYDAYQIFDATEELKNFTHSIFPFPHTTRVQRITKDLIIHKDFGRSMVFNFIVSTGGKNVETCFYNEKNILIEKHKIEQQRWHFLNVLTPHNVINIELARVALTIHVST